MEKIKSFLYLDNYKMYSISSQLFEGLTEYIVKNERENNQESESQKGPIGSGRILGDIIQKSSEQKEKKFLHDYSYNLFEKALIEKKKVVEVDKTNINSTIPNLKEYSFIKVKGRVVFNDLKIIEDTMSRFNEVGYALGYITMKATYDEEMQKLNEQVIQIGDRNQKAKAKNYLKNNTKFSEILKDKGLQLDDDYLKNLAYLINYGYNQQFEVHIPLTESCLFSAQFDRNNLKDDEHRIIKKYSRETEKEFVLFGIITQINKESEKVALLQNKTVNWGDSNENANMKEALMNLVRAITGVEKTFTGKLDYEYVIDPISLYLEL